MQNEARRGSQSFRLDWRAAGAIFGMEAMPTDPVLESLGTRWPTEESTTAADGVGSEERLATTAANAMETPRATMGTAETSEVGAGATDVMPKSRAQRPAVSEEQTVCPEMSQGVVGRSVQPPSPQGTPPDVEKEDEVEEIEHEES